MQTEITQLKGIKFLYRPNTTDIVAIKEVLTKNPYQSKTGNQIEPEDHWLDLGANIGAFTLLALSKGAKVTAYEPEPQNYDLLQKNLELNKQNATTHQSAVTGDGQSITQLFTCKGQYNKYRHHLKPTRGRTPIMVNVTPITKAINTQITAIKMDIEGSEFTIIPHLKDWKNVKKLVMEYHHDHQRSMPIFWEHIKYLKQHFTNIKHKKMPTTPTYAFYPASTIIHAWND